ncbi:DNA sulfur modification protein DndB [Paenibacillus elgii]|uniref:DNA sulfur modification protein DndB n=1 Tax=Paenibacillus elgii TaxID=189691 RepID=UPI0013CF6E86|nr:DNA sulfur modification protein DndB [Paenibacillus elgii]
MNGYHFAFPAIRGVQATREYYVAMCPLGILPRVFQIPDEELLPEFRAQRVLNKNRIPIISRYILQNPEDYVFSSLAASVDGDMSFLSSSDSSLGTLSISMNARILINDGQHRRAAIEEALKQNPELATETISVVFFYDRGLNRCQQMFADLNKHSINTSKSLGILYDNRDPFSNFVRDIVEEISFLRDFTNKEIDNLSGPAPQLFTLTNIFNSVERILGKKRGEPISSEDVSFARFYWQSLCQTFAEWKEVQQKKMRAPELRKNYIHAHGVVLDALGLLGHELYQQQLDPKNVKKIVSKLNKINWKRTNMNDWLDRAIRADGNILKQKIHPSLTYIHIKRLIGMNITATELSIEEKYLGKRESKEGTTI